MPIPAPSPSPPSGRAPGPALQAPAPSEAAPRYGPDRFEPAALVLAFLLPGLGHWYLGEKRRAKLIAGGILGLFFGGIFIGGIDAVDRKEDTIWFVGQALVGPVAFGVDYTHQEFFKVRLNNGVVRSAWPNEVRRPDGTPGEAKPGQRPPNSKSLGRMNELGTLFSTIAGMLNLLVIIDASMHGRRK